MDLTYLQDESSILLIWLVHIFDFSSPIFDLSRCILGCCEAYHFKCNV